MFDSNASLSVKGLVARWLTIRDSYAWLYYGTNVFRIIWKARNRLIIGKKSIIVHQIPQDARLLFTAYSKLEAAQHLQPENSLLNSPHWSPPEPGVKMFRPSSGDSFVGKGFRNWRKKTRLHNHNGKRNSAHNISLKNCVALLNQKQHINSVIFKKSEETKREYRKRLRASINCSRFLLRQGLAFRGHDEDEDEESHNRGNFIELLQWLADNNEEIRVDVLDNAPGNQKLIAPDIQKDITKCFSSEILSQIVKEIGDGPFSILLDESKDISSKEQVAIVLRYVHKDQVIERFLGIEHVNSTTVVSLKATVDDFFSRHGLSISRLRGQGYDGESNMKGEYNGLKLAVVVVAKKHTYVEHLYVIMSNLVNVVAGSAKHQDMLRSKQADAVFKALCSGDIVSGRGLNQERTLKRVNDTRWGSHHSTIVSLINTSSSIVTLLEDLVVDSDKKFEAKVLLDALQNFNFIFSLHLMRTILGITNDFSKALQRKDQDIVNAMKLITAPHQNSDMNDVFQREGRPRRNVEEVTNSYHYRAEYFNTVINMQLLELNNRFNETNTELLLSVACLSPIDSFSAFDKDKLIRFSRFYPRYFSPTQLVLLEDQLLNYIADVRSSNEFLDLKGIADLPVKMVETKKDIVYPLIYLLLTLELLLPVATTTIERVFSVIKVVKNRLLNRMGDEWMNDILI
ncbi:zinc finger MYM-type protein 1-like [Papaver somniferum]|uniref:zinc finger MYM-type protein 1-like n=1 Tax=Papaver somniferum TaxID=3469 RepID=UPI000E6FFF70|nr:zinc finger MYM-type protein 1-like [Papaver somniferum]